MDLKIERNIQGFPKVVQVSHEQQKAQNWAMNNKGAIVGHCGHNILKLTIYILKFQINRKKRVF